MKRKGFFERVGSYTLSFFFYLGSLILLGVRVIVSLFSTRFHKKLFLQEMKRFGTDSIFIIGIISLFIGMTIVMEVAKIMRLIGGKMFVGSIVSLSTVREIGPICCAFLISGRVGAAIAAEIGSMKISEQIDALKTSAVDPVGYLVVPKMLAAIITLPALTLFCMLLSIFGGYLIATYGLGVSGRMYLFQAFRFIEMKDLGVGFLKAFVFGITIVLVSCYEGFSTKGGAEGIGRSTTTAVVISFFSIIFADLLLTAIFYFK